MTNSEYIAIRITISRISEILCQLPLEEYIADTERAVARIRAKDGVEYHIAQAKALYEAQKLRAEFRKTQPANAQIVNAVASAQILKLISNYHLNEPEAAAFERKATES